MHSRLYSIYVYVLIIIKLYYIITLIVIRVQKSTNTTLIETNTISKNIVMGMLASLMIYLFHPIRRGVVVVQGETKALMFLFGILGLLDIPWDVPFHRLLSKGNMPLSQQQFSLLLGIIITALLSIVVQFV